MQKIKKYLILLTVVVLSGCGGAKVESQPSLSEMYKDAYDKIDDNNYAEAANKFLEIESTYSTSEWAPKALIYAAYSQYKADDFASALTTIDRFMRFHPGHENVDYVLYLKGMCFYRQVSDVRREPGMSSYALSAFEQLTQRFPDSKYSKNAKNKIVILKNYIAGKIMYSVRRDLVKKNYPVAITNLQKIITTMQETKMTPEALYRLTEAYTALGLKDQAKGYAEILNKNFPNSEWSKKL
jgi:outer membrane protein assembly factor BamD